jgi:hypothetical protein
VQTIEWLDAEPNAHTVDSFGHPHVHPCPRNHGLTGLQQGTFVSLESVDGTSIIEAQGQRVRIPDGHMQYDGYWHRKFAREAAEKPSQGLGAAGGRADDDDANARVRLRDDGDGSQGPGRLGETAVDLALSALARLPRSSRYFYLQDDVGRKLVQPVRRKRRGLVNELDRPRFKGLDRKQALLIARAYDDASGLGLVAKGPQHAETIEVWHEQVEGHHVGLELGDFLEGIEAIAGNAHDLDLGIARKNFAYDFARECGVVDNQDTNHSRGFR